MISVRKDISRLERFAQVLVSFSLKIADFMPRLDISLNLICFCPQACKFKINTTNLQVLPAGKASQQQFLVVCQ